MGEPSWTLLLLLLALLWRRGLQEASQEENPEPGPVNTLLLSRPCGQPNIRSRIVGGEESKRGRWPWQALVWVPNGESCGGSLLNRRWVLSAAHCFRRSSDASKWLVQLGEVSRRPFVWNLRTYLNRYRVKDIIVSPQSRGKFHDIALLRLASSVTFSKYIQPVCVLSSTFMFVHRSDCWVTGWGALSEENEPLPPPYRLREVQVTIMNNSRCRELFQLPYPFSLIDADVFCAGAEEGNKDACHGDSGGPLVCHLQGLWYQVGIVSWGMGCGRPNRPGVYTNISQYFEWLWSRVSHSATKPGGSLLLLSLPALLELAQGHLTL